MKKQITYLLLFVLTAFALAKCLHTALEAHAKAPVCTAKDSTHLHGYVPECMICTFTLSSFSSARFYSEKCMLPGVDFVFSDLQPAAFQTAERHCSLRAPPVKS